MEERNGVELGVAPRPLEKDFRSKGFHFEQIGSSVEYDEELGRESGMYLYRCTAKKGATHYEVFERRVNVLYNTVTYPSDECFGKWAKCCRKLERAQAYLREGLNAESIPQK